MILKKELLLEILILSILIFIFHKIAIILSLYWITDWFDILMHFLGGFVVGLMSAFIFYTSGYCNFSKENKASIFTMIIGPVLVVGLTWELWEIFVGLTDVLADQSDTVFDLIMDTFGGLLAFAYTYKKIWKIE